MRNFVHFSINGKEYKVSGSKAFMQMSDFLRYDRCLTGTKVVCAEGDCGACSIMKATPQTKEYLAVNSCISPVFIFDGCHIVTVEGLKQNNQLHPIQKAMNENFGAQCGFCTPGFVVALANMFEQKSKITEKMAKNFLTGNLCRCTGYQDIINAAVAVRPKDIKKVKDMFKPFDLEPEEVSIEHENLRLFLPKTLDSATQFLKDHPHTRIVSGATDLGVQVNKEKTEFLNVMSLHLIDDLFKIEERDGSYFVGAKSSLDAIEKYFEKHIPEFAEFLTIFASPQIKNHATLVGNIANASPIADTTPCLMSMDAIVHLQSAEGKRSVPLDQFYLDYKKMDLKPGELITALEIPSPPQQRFFKNYKVSQRRDLDISCVNASIIAQGTDQIDDIRISWGGVGPTTLRMKKTEATLKGKSLDQETINQAKQALLSEMTPITDARGSAEFRKLISMNLLDKFQADWEART
jgi:xanthine dehydrogenase small subunit